MVSPNIINRLVAAKHQLRIAEENVKSSFSAAQYAAINNLHDSVEMFLLSIAEAVGSITTEQSFDKYFVNINAAAQAFTGNNKYELPFKGDLLKLNRTRVSSKHHSVLPDKREVERFTIVVRSFYEEVCRSLLQIEFSTISLADLIIDSNIRPHIKQAQSDFEVENYYSCLVECRKCVYIRIEDDYDIQRYKSKRFYYLEFEGLNLKAPLYSREINYIEKNVRTPFDYIVIDAPKLDLELVKAGIPTEMFWNIHTLTPSVYYDRKIYHEDVEEDFLQGVWRVKNDYTIELKQNLRDVAEYVLEETVNLLIKLEEHSGRRRLHVGKHHLLIKVPTGATIYEKASKFSKVLDFVPAFITEAYAKSKVPSLDNESEFYYIECESREFTYYTSGYIAVEDVSFTI